MGIPVVGLTGGIGSGKSAAAERFAELGVAVVDTDLIAHQLTGPGGAAMAAIEREFGPAALTAQGALNRPAMREKVFADPASKKRLEAILHPAIHAESLRQLESARGDYALLVVPLLFESDRYLPLLARTLVVDCSENTQLERVMRRSGLSEEAVRAIMSAQLSRTERLRRADDSIDNDGSLAELRLQVDAKHGYYLANLVNALL
ncbi:dephospho-CoA kinase [Chromobacterium sp. IIBBL 290-4]|uniref:dephospho-CoA kinase n=1 Tax=Chromobacterium sp. IIBBL 290-4 TaxID=2953890 RepID=UPI0020B69B7F|nr:dephospho-CoA kinase [Chromobacterium sp. IIBBL 290-4]UTH72265.1 dephospho-CoA kinase [Chromobacterium sp. IIBBL 290-4]